VVRIEPGLIDEAQLSEISGLKSMGAFESVHEDRSTDLGRFQVMGCRWVVTIKDQLDKLVKARITALGYSDMRDGMSKSSPTLSMDTLRTFLRMKSAGGPLVISDCKKAYINAPYDDSQIKTLIKPPKLASGKASEKPGHLWLLLLKKALYGLSDAVCL